MNRTIVTGLAAVFAILSVLAWSPPPAAAEPKPVKLALIVPL